MADPITWRTVLGPSIADASRPMAIAQQGFNAAFDNFNRTLEAQQAARQRVTDREEQGRLLNYQELLQSARTPEELAAMQGQLETLRGGLNTNSRAQVLGAFDKRLNETRQGVTAERSFNDANAAYELRPIIQEAQALYAAGDRAGGDALLAPYKNRLANFGELARQGVIDERAATEWGWKGEDIREKRKEWKHKANLRPLELRSKDASIRASEASAANSAMNTTLARLQMKQARSEAQSAEVEHQRELVRTGMVRDNSFYKDYMTPEKNIEAATKAIDSRTDLNKDEKTNLRAALGKALYYDYSDGKGNSIKVPVPLPILETAIQTADTGWLMDRGVSDNFTEAIKKRMQEVGPEVLDDYRALQTLSKYNIQNPPASRKAGK